jgi:putative addiction module component (TIGR02574 family)
MAVPTSRSASADQLRWGRGLLGPRSRGGRLLVFERPRSAGGLVRASSVRYPHPMGVAAKLLEQAMQLPEAEREELAATLLDSLEAPPGISIEDREEIERRAEEARAGVPGITWDEVKRSLPK